MTAVPLPTGFKAVDDFPKLRESLVNLFSTGNGLLRTPGIDEVSNTSGVCRGRVFFKERLYMVFGTSLTRIDPDNTLTVVGQIPGDAPVIMEPGFVYISIIVKGGSGFRYSETDGLEQTVDNQFVPSVDLAVIKGITVYIPADGGPAFYSDPNNPSSIRGFFDAEDLPDINKGVFNFNNDLHIMGAETIQIFRNFAGADEAQPFTPIEGATAQVGYVGGKMLYAPSFAFIGKNREEGFSIRIMGSGRAPRISNDAIDELLNLKYTEAELEQVTSASYEWKGYQVLCFRLPRHTLCYFGGNWFFQESGINGANSNPWGVNYIAFAYGKYYVGDASQFKLGVLADIPTEYGNRMEYSLDTFVRGPRGSYFTARSAEIDCLVGKGTADTQGTVGLTVSNDGVVWNLDRTIWRGMGESGDYNRRVSWIVPGGLGSYESFMGVRVRSTGNVDFAMETLDVEF